MINIHYISVQDLNFNRQTVTKGLSSMLYMTQSTANCFFTSIYDIYKVQFKLCANRYVILIIKLTFKTFIKT